MDRHLEKFSREVIEIMPFIVREFAKREDNELTRGKISCSQMVTLDYVSRHTRVPLTEIAHALGTKNSSASILVNRLIQQKMLSRRRDEDDRRVVWISATAKGRKVLSQILTQKRYGVREVFKPLTVRERGQYLSLLNKVKAHIISEQEKLR